MTIGICDDLKAAVLELQGIIEEDCRKKEITADIVTFDRGKHHCQWLLYTPYA